MVHSRIDSLLDNPKKALFTLSWPIIISMMVQTLYSLVDMAFVGRLGPDSLAALTFAFPIFFISLSMAFGTGTGMNALISQAIGKKDRKDAENIAIHGILAGIGLASILIILGNVFVTPLLSLFGATNETAVLSVSYLRIIFFGFIFMFPAYIFNNIFISQGDTKTPMKVQIISLLLNMILDPVFIYYFDMGVKGAAIATAISFLTGFVIFLFMIRKKSQLSIKKSNFLWKPSILVRIFSLGLPASFMMILFSLQNIYLNWFMAGFGTEYVAVLGIISRLESVAILPVISLAIALLTLVGMLYGAKRHDLLKGISWFGIRVGAAIAASIGFLFFIFPEFFLSIFVNDQSLINLAIPYLRIDIFSLPMIGVSIIISRIKQGLGRGLPGLVLNIIRVVLVGFPLSYLFIMVYGFPYTSLAIALLSASFVSMLVALAWIIYRLKNI